MPGLDQWKTWSRSPNVRNVVAIVAALAVVNGAMLWAGSGTARQGSGHPPAPTAISPPSTGWSALTIPDLPSVATLVAQQRDETGIRPDSTFAMASLTNENAVDLATRLETSPSVELHAAAGQDAAHATVRPTHQLTAGTLYRFTLRSPDGELTGSWSFRVRSPLHVQSTIPGDRTTSVPINRGIELTFDQEGAADIAPFFSITPKVSGRFERHGRTQVFVPDHLAQGTVYTVTLKAGLPRTGTDLRLEHDVVVRFETQSTTSTRPAVLFGRDALEWSPGDPPVVGIVMPDPETISSFKAVNVVVSKYRDQISAAKALTDFLLAPRWTSYTQPKLDTAGLPIAARFSATVQQTTTGDQYRIFRFPAALPPGFYAVQIQGQRPAYAFLQISRIAGWTAVFKDRTVMWVNDVVSGSPVAGARAEILGGASLGTTNAQGLAVVQTPDALKAAGTAPDQSAGSARVVAVQAPGGATVVIPFGVRSDPGIYAADQVWGTDGPADDVYWSMLHTDRDLYRRSDRIEVSGYLRGRDDGSVPASVSLELVPAESPDSPALARIDTTPSRAGVYLGTLSYDRLPYGNYVLRAVVSGRTVSQTSVEIGVIRKPAYELALTSSHRAIIQGQSIDLGVAATFFDGSPVPSVPLHVNVNGTDGPGLQTDTSGSAHFSLRPSAQDANSTEYQSYIAVSPQGPEEGEIQADTDVYVFASTDYINAAGTVRSGELAVNGSVHAVDLARVDRERAAGTWTGDGSGRAIAGRRVSVVVTRLHQVRTQEGTKYDPIEKVVVPVYRYDVQRIPLRSTSVTSGGNGAFSLTMSVPNVVDSYEIKLSSTDPRGRVEVRTIEASTETGACCDLPEFRTSTGEPAGQEAYSVGEPINWRLSETNASNRSPSSMYLYLVAQRGLLGVATSRSSTFSRPFQASDSPGIYVMGVRFTGHGYTPKADAWALFDSASRTLSVTVAADRPSYRPGEDATLTIRVKDSSGRPVAADVVLQAVDQKLFAAHAATVPDPVRSLYQQVGSGLIAIASTHQGPGLGGGEGLGGAGGGGARTDFRDTLVSRLVRTAADGSATTRVHLSDDLTSWHVIASAYTAGLSAGVGERLIPVGLPFFLDVTTADEYLVADRPSIRLRAYGLALKAGDPVQFTVRIPSLGVAPTQVRGTAFTPTEFRLPALTAGRHEIDVAVQVPTRLDAAGKPLGDRLIRPIEVVTSRVTTAASWYGTISDRLPTVDTPDLAQYTFTDAGAGRYLPLLLDAVGTDSVRLDRNLASDAALKLLVNRFGMDLRTLPTSEFDPARYAPDTPDSDIPGVALVPDGSADPWLTARVAALTPGSLPEAHLRALLAAIRDDDQTPRDLEIAVLPGIATFDSSVQADLRAALALPDLTATERIDIALGFARLGDESTARTVELGLLKQYGQQLGAWVRLNVGDRDATSEGTALLAVVAASIGDPLAPAMVDYATNFPSGSTSNSLETVTAAGLALERSPRVTARFAYTVDGKRQETAMEPGSSFTISLSAKQRAGLRLETISGSVGLAITWRHAVDVRTLPSSPDLKLQRIPPPRSISPDSVLITQLQASFTGAALDGCYEVVEHLPSGLAPIPGAWSDEEGVIWPMSIAGQDVQFCVPLGKDTPRQFNLKYAARVVSTGTFVWEAATMQHPSVSDAFTASDSGSASIGTGS